MAEYLDMDYLLKLGEIDPELAAFLEKNPMPKMDYSDLADFKKLIAIRDEMNKHLFADHPPEIKISETQYTTRDGTKMRAKLFQPAKPNTDGTPLVVMYHGGGFCIGMPEGEEQTCRNFVQAFGAVCISVAYRLAPEFAFPYAIHDSWDALKWAAANAQSWGADPSVGFVIGGTSAGGNITAVLAHLARDEALSPPLTGQYLAIPAVCPRVMLPEKYTPYSISYEQNSNTPILPQAAIDLFMRGYKPDNNDPLYAVFNHPKGHSDLPTAFFQIDGMDPLRDEGLIYERVLREEYGLKTRLNVYPGLPHGHWGMFPFLKGSALFRKDQVEGMGWLLGRVADMSKVVLSPPPATV